MKMAINSLDSAIKGSSAGDERINAARRMINSQTRVSRNSFSTTYGKGDQTILQVEKSFLHDS